jgi:3-oxoacyl-[acyl-carrier protein] reductase
VSGGGAMSAKRVALITGADGGIGGAVAKVFSQAGYSLFLGDLKFNESAQRRTVGDGISDAYFKRLDVTSEESTAAFFDDALSACGQIDVLVNSAGVTSFGASSDIDLEEWERVIRVNLTGTFLCCKAALAGMIPRRSGKIINIGSVIAKNGGNARPWLDPTEQARMSNVAYGVSKSGVHTLTTFLAREVARHGITVNAVAPGPVSSAMTQQLPNALTQSIPLGRFGRVDEVAYACQYLASDQASYITGEILDLNGGLWSD